MQRTSGPAAWAHPRGERSARIITPPGLVAILAARGSHDRSWRTQPEDA
jgi:hypothetical protein